MKRTVLHKIQDPALGMVSIVSFNESSLQTYSTIYQSSCPEEPIPGIEPRSLLERSLIRHGG